MSYTIVGAGAIGGLIGSALAEAGHDVTFVEANPAHREALNSDGLHVTGWRDFSCRVSAVAPEEIDEELDRVLLAVKSIHTADAVRSLSGKLASEGYIVSLQNGLNEYTLVDEFGADRVIGAYLTFGGFLEGPGRIRYAGEGSFKLGELDGRISERIEALASDLRALQRCEVTRNIWGYLWAKMVLGGVYYGTAVLDSDVSDIYADAEALEVLGRAAREGAEVARLNGVKLEECDGFRPAAFAEGDAAGIESSWEAQRAYWGAHVGNNRTGVWRDLAVHKRKTECSEHVGAVIRCSGDHPTPTLDRIAIAVAEIEAGQRDLGWHNLAFIAGKVADAV